MSLSLNTFKPFIGLPAGTSISMSRLPPFTTPKTMNDVHNQISGNVGYPNYLIGPSYHSWLQQLGDFYLYDHNGNVLRWNTYGNIEYLMVRQEPSQHLNGLMLVITVCDTKGLMGTIIPCTMEPLPFLEE